MLEAIDMHVHILTGDRAKQGWAPATKAGLPMNTGKWGHTPDEMAVMYQSLRMMAVIFDVDGETRSGLKIDNGETAAWVKKYPKTFIGFGSVDPWKGKVARGEVQRCADIGLRGMNGIEVARRLRETNARPKVLVISVHSDQRFVQAALDAGVAGYVHKSAIGRELLRAVHALAQGGKYFPQQVPGRE